MDRQAAGEGRPRPHGGLPQMHALEGCGWSCGLEAREEAVMTVFLGGGTELAWDRALEMGKRRSQVAPRQLDACGPEVG